MNWKNTFEVNEAPDKVFATLLDVPTIAPCMPGATLTGQTDDGAYEGTVKVKLGPITAQYKGKARITSTDEAARTAVLLAEGSETRGQGTARATITATCQPAGEGTAVEIDTDLHLTGKVAQFGRGVLQDVSAKLIGQFSSCLSTNVFGTGAAQAAPDPEPAETESEATDAPKAAVPVTERRAPYREVPEAIDLQEVAGAAVAKRVVPVIIGVVLLALIWRALSGRKS